MMYWWGDLMSGWGYALMAFSSIAFWALLILGIVVLVRVARSSRSAGPAGIDRPTPEQLLAERYARGEIDDDEYEHRPEHSGWPYADEPWAVIESSEKGGTGSIESAAGDGAAAGHSWPLLHRTRRHD